MKKLIGLVTSLSSVFLISSSMVSCGSSQKASNEYKENENNFLSEIDKELFEEKLSIEGIDGSIFDTENNGSDVLQLIKEEIREIDKNAKNIDLIDEKEKYTFLEQGNNYFTVSFESSNVKYELPVLIKSVKDVKKLDVNEVEPFVSGVLGDSELLTVGYEDENLNTDQVTRWKNVITKKLERRLKDVNVNVRTASTSNQSEMKVIVEVDNLPYGIKKQTKEIIYNTFSMEKSGLNISPRAEIKFKYQELVKKIKNTRYNVKNFTTHQKKKEVLFFWIKNIKSEFKANGLDEPSIDYNNNEVLEYLTEGDNTINIRIAENDYVFTHEDVILKLSQVKKAAPENNLKFNVIEKFLTSGIDASKLHEGHTYRMAAVLARTEVQKISPDADIFIDNSPSLDRNELKTGDNTIILKVSLKSKTSSVSVLFKNVKPFSNVGAIKEIYDKPVKYNWNSGSIKNYENVVSKYQASINSHFASQNVKMSLKNNNDKTKKIKPGSNLIEVVYEQNGKKDNGLLKPYEITEQSDYKPDYKPDYNPDYKPDYNPSEGVSKALAIAKQYATQGIDVKKLADHISVENNVYEAFDAVRRFLNENAVPFLINPADKNEILNSKLKQGDNKINTTIFSDGKALKFTFTLKNVGGKSPHYGTSEKYKDSQDKKLWDVFNLIGSPNLPRSMAGRTMNEIPSSLQLLIEQQHKISGVKISAYESTSVLSQKIVAGKQVPFKVSIQDVSTKRNIIVTLNIYVYVNSVFQMK